MAQVGNVSKSLTANGTAAGIVTVDDNSGFGIGAYCFISSTSVPTTNCIVLNKVGSTGLLLGKVAGYQSRGFDFSVLNVSGFLLADGAGIVQPAQLTEAITPEPVDQGGTGLDYVPYGNLVMGNDGLPMIKVAPGTAGNALLSDGTKWYSAAVSADGVLSVTAVEPLYMTGTAANPIVNIRTESVVVDPPPGSWSFAAGTPVAIIGGNVVACQASTDTTFPCVGVWNSDNKICNFGLVDGITAGDWAANDLVYVAAAGGLSKFSTDSGAGTVELRVGVALSTTSIFVSMGREIYNS